MSLKHAPWELKQMQSLPLNQKISLTKQRIRDWYREFGGKVYLSFSGGKDSTVLLDIVKQLYPDIPVVYVDTGLEWPQVRSHAMQYLSEKLRPALDFRTVLQVYGYPIISKEVSQKISEYRKGFPSAVKSFMPGAREARYDYSKWSFLLSAPFLISNQCCHKTKKAPCKVYEKETGRKPIVATMAVESMARRTSWLQHGCNAYDSDRPISTPMSFWTEQDVLKYIKVNNLSIASVYGDIVCKTDLPEQLSFYDIFEPDTPEDLPTLKCTGCERTGCIFCGYGCHHDARPNRFELLDINGNTNLRDYCMRGGAFDTDGMWKPNNEGLGFWFVLQYLNVHGRLNIFIPEYDRYERTYGNECTKKYLK